MFVQALPDINSALCAVTRVKSRYASKAEVGRRARGAQTLVKAKKRVWTAIPTAIIE